MLPLTAVQPHGRGVVDHDGVRGCRGSRERGGHEARVDALDGRGDVLDGRAGRVKGRLRDGVVGGCELELDHVAYSGFQIVGREGEGAVERADADDVDSGTSGGWSC